MPRLLNEISEHDELVLMMAKYFQQLGYTDIKADISGWPQPTEIYWTKQPDVKYRPDLTCYDLQKTFIILEAETCGSLSDQHTKEQFKIFSAHAKQNNGYFEVVVPKMCQGSLDVRQKVKLLQTEWSISINNIWTPK